MYHTKEWLAYILVIYIENNSAIVKFLLHTILSGMNDLALFYVLPIERSLELNYILLLTLYVIYVFEEIQMLWFFFRHKLNDSNVVIVLHAQTNGFKCCDFSSGTN